MNILVLLQKDGILPKRVSSTHGGEFASACPSCQGKDRFRSWPGQGDGGRWWCRGCGKGGDAIEYLKEFHGLTYLQACEILGIEPKSRKISASVWGGGVNVQGTGHMTDDKHGNWSPKDTAESPCAIWQEKAPSLVEWAERQLWSASGKEAVEWLKAERGLQEPTIKFFHLGWNPKDIWLERKIWGLQEELKENGKPKKLWVPRGLLIPFICDGLVQKIKIRRPAPDAEPRYYLLPGSSAAPMMLANEDISAFVVVESELDLILIHQVAGNLVNIAALGSAQIRPDERASIALKAADAILLALDSDDAGAKQVEWWSRKFGGPSLKRWPPVDGKDPGEMLKAGVDVRVWIQAGLMNDDGEEDDSEESKPSSAVTEEIESIETETRDYRIDNRNSPEQDHQNAPIPSLKTVVRQSPFQSRCIDCARQKGCDREEIRAWGFMNLHDCPALTSIKTEEERMTR